MDNGHSPGVLSAGHVNLFPSMPFTALAIICTGNVARIYQTARPGSSKRMSHTLIYLFSWISYVVLQKIQAQSTAQAPLSSTLPSVHRCLGLCIQQGGPDKLCVSSHVRRPPCLRRCNANVVDIFWCSNQPIRCY